MFRRWYWPFLWILIVPLATLPASIALQEGLDIYDQAQIGVAYGSTWVERDYALRTLAPALLNLLVFAWLLAGTIRTAWATLWIGVIAVARLAVPAVILFTTGVVGADGIHYVDWTPTRAMIFVAELELWLGGLLLWLLFALTTRVQDRYVEERMGPAEEGWSH